jgi:hypothetical protein
MTARPAPSEEAIALLREEARQLDVEDLVDLCYARMSEPLRTSIYLEALRGRPGEQAQVAACLLCFDLARRGDERREAEVHFLLPTLEHLFAPMGSPIGEGAAPLPRSVAALAARSPVVAELWSGLVTDAARRDPRTRAVLPEVDDSAAIEVSLFDDAERAALEVELGDVDLDLDFDEEAFRAFDAGLQPLIPPPPTPLFRSADGDDLDRLEKLRDHCRSFAARVPVAAELLALTQLYLATHTRALGLFGRRNKRRDKALVDGVTALLSLPAPPSQAAAWFARSDVPGAEPYAWDKVAELLLDVVSYVAPEDPELERHGPRARGPDRRSADVWAAEVAADFAADPRSSKIPPRLAVGDRRRR